MPRLLPAILVLSTLCAGGCGSDSRREPPGGGAPDAGPLDADGGAGPPRDAGRSADTGLDTDASPPSDAGPADAGPSPTCPPAGPFGTSPGQTIPDVTLLDCDGVAHSLHDLCAHEVSWVFEYTDWCPPCRDFAARADAIYRSHAARDLAAFFIVAEDDSFGPPTAELCADVRARYGLGMTVLFDPTQSFASTLGVPTNDFHLVMTRGNVVHWTGRYADDEIESRLDAAFGL